MRNGHLSFSACLPGACRPRHVVSMNVALPSLELNLPSANRRFVPTILPSLKSTAGSWKPLVPVARRRSYAQLHELLTSMPGVGPVLAFTLIALLPELGT